MQTFSTGRLPLHSSALVILSLAGTLGVQADFSGAFAPANWDLSTHMTDGASGAFTGSSTLTIQGPSEDNGGTFVAGAAKISISSPGTIQLNWSASYTGETSWGFDRPFYYVTSDATLPSAVTDDPWDDSTHRFIPNDNSTGAKSGSLNIQVVAGDYFWLGVASDTQGGAATLILNNFSFTPVPEPHEYGMVAGAFLLGFAVWRRSQKAHQAANGAIEHGAT